jgi:hypothetical protein
MFYYLHAVNCAITLRPQKMKSFNLSLVFLVFFSVSLMGQTYTPIFTPGDPIFGGELQAGEFVTTSWPPFEAPMFAIDGLGQKHLNFNGNNTGIVITPSSGSAIATQLQIWTANDVEGRDPSSYEIYGTNVPLGSPPFALSNFNLIASGPLSLPSTRNAGGSAALDNMNSQTIQFANNSAYESYMIIFPTLKGASEPFMQIAEVQVFFSDAAVVPTLGQWGLISLGLLLLIFGVSFSKNVNFKIQQIKQ